MFSFTNLETPEKLLVIDLGAKVTNLCLIQEKHFEYIRSLDFGVNIIVDEISKSLKIGVEDAEGLLIDYCQNNFNKIDFYSFRKAVLKVFQGRPTQALHAADSLLKALLTHVGAIGEVESHRELNVHVSFFSQRKLLVHVFFPHVFSSCTDLIVRSSCTHRAH